jgi:hypothetical protein
MQAYRRRLTSDDMAVREEAAAVSSFILFSEYLSTIVDLSIS